MSRKVSLPILAAAVLTFAVVGCDFSPSSPFAGFAESQRQGATLNGQFEQSSATRSRPSVASDSVSQRGFASTNNAQLTATQVFVFATDGSELGSVDIDSDGSFTLRGLPESFFLVFVDENGEPIGEPIEFDGVKPNQEVDIVVVMEDGNIVLVQERRTGIDHEGSSGIEIEGVARNIVIDSDPMTGSLEVNGHHVITRAAETSIRKGNRSLTLEDLDEGDRVHVRGVFEGDNVFAFEIKLQEDKEEEEESEDVGEEKVTLCHIPPGNPDKAKTITVGESAVPAHLAHGDHLGPCK